MSLDLDNIVRVSVSGPERGLAEVNTSVIALITDEAPIPADYGTYQAYKNPEGVADDFGSSSETYRLANIIFSQKKNILSGGGFLIVIPRDQTADAQPAVILGSKTVNFLTLSATDYNIKAAVDGAAAADLLIGEIDTTDISSIQTSLNSTAVTGAGLQFVVSGEVSAAKVTLQTVSTGATAAIVISAATTGTDIAPLLGISGSVTGAAAGVERVKDAILRTAPAVSYFGIVLNEKQTDAALTELAALVQTYDKLLAVGSNLSADLTGVFKTLKDAGYTHTRCMLYTLSENSALDFAAAYLSRLMSINFSGANTALTMNLKDITGLTADTGITQTLYNSAKANGVDIYPDFGIGKVITSGANLFSDQIYTRLALKVKLQIAGFNFLAQTDTKEPQTEDGMNGLKGAYRSVFDRFVTVGVYAPGTWNSSTRFGDPEDHDRNILEKGYFIYSAPIASQSQTEREARVAPLIQIAAKESGALHGSDLSILVEA